MTLKTSPESSRKAANIGGSYRSLNEVCSLVDDFRTSGRGWYLRTAQFATGDVEVVALSLCSDDSLRNGGGAKRENDSKDQMTETVLKKSQARARKQVRHKLMMLQADRLLTLTYRENQTDIKQGWKDLQAFNRKMKWRFKDRWQYVAVPEYQKRGAVHWHLAISGYFPVKTVRRFWREIVGEGNIDITSPKERIQKNSWNPKRIANYLSKYIQKNDSVAFNKRRFSSTQIPPPESKTGWLVPGLSVGQIMRKLINGMTRKPAASFWEGEGYFPMCLMTT